MRSLQKWMVAATAFLASSGNAQTIDMSGFVNTNNLGAIQNSARLMTEGTAAEDRDQMCANSRSGDECRIRNGLPPRGGSKREALSTAGIDGLAFTASPDIRARHFADIIDHARALGGDVKAANMQRFLDSESSIIMASAGTMATMGLRTTNVGDAVAFYIIAHWMAARGSLTVPTNNQASAVQRQFSAALIASNDIRAMSSAKKQAIAEEHIVYAMLTLGALQGAKGDAATTAYVAQHATQSLKNLGFDPNLMTLGEAGFVGAK